MSKEYRIEILFDKGSYFATTLPEEGKNLLLRALDDENSRMVSFGPDDKNDTYIVNLKNVNVIKIYEINNKEEGKS